MTGFAFQCVKKTKMTDKFCKRRTDIPTEWKWSAGDAPCEANTCWQGEWRWISYRAYSVNLCTPDDKSKFCIAKNFSDTGETILMNDAKVR